MKPPKQAAASRAVRSVPACLLQAPYLRIAVSLETLHSSRKEPPVQLLLPPLNSLPPKHRCIDRRARDRAGDVSAAHK